MSDRFAYRVLSVTLIVIGVGLSGVGVVQFFGASGLGPNDYESTRTDLSVYQYESLSTGSQQFVQRAHENLTDTQATSADSHSTATTERTEPSGIGPVTHGGSDTEDRVSDVTISVNQIPPEFAERSLVRYTDQYYVVVPRDQGDQTVIGPRDRGDKTKVGTHDGGDNNTFRLTVYAGTAFAFESLSADGQKVVTKTLDSHGSVELTRSVPPEFAVYPGDQPNPRLGYGLYYIIKMTPSTD
ncbi:hypothetical protein [Salinibaculum rarum]|uniref:hypothetical protein n=1 Tax=Salinibaculum rarum TaxID=3058903 RepID=UPI00265DA15B|nr:hypothetical protein [Salinibaculum sp. KK48]